MSINNAFVCLLTCFDILWSLAYTKAANFDPFVYTIAFV